MVESQPSKLLVAGSIPVSRSSFSKFTGNTTPRSGYIPNRQYNRRNAGNSKSASIYLIPFRQNA